MNSDLFGAPLGGDVLGVGQLGPPTVAGERDQILSDHRYRTSRTFLPRRIGCRVDDNLADDSPTSVMRVATRNKKTRERVGHSLGPRLGCVDVEMPKCGTDVSAVIYRPRQFPRGPPRFASLILDPSTVAGHELMSDGSSFAR